MRTNYYELPSSEHSIAPFAPASLCGDRVMRIFRCSGYAACYDSINKISKIEFVRFLGRWNRSSNFTPASANQLRFISSLSLSFPVLILAAPQVMIIFGIITLRNFPFSWILKSRERVLRVKKVYKSKAPKPCCEPRSSSVSFLVAAVVSIFALRVNISVLPDSGS